MTEAAETSTLLFQRHQKSKRWQSFKSQCTLGIL